jgi:hypothetical protein
MTCAKQKYSEIPKFSEVVDDGVCSPCREGKATKLPFRDNFEHTDKVGEIIHSDMAGKLPVSFPDRYQCKTRHLRIWIFVSNFHIVHIGVLIWPHIGPNTDRRGRHVFKAVFRCLSCKGGALQVLAGSSVTMLLLR